MSLSNQFLATILCLYVPCTQAFQLYFDSIYWRASESFDWVLLNDRHLPNQHIAYKTANFHYEPGFRAGVIIERNWETALCYTRYQTSMSDSASGAVTPTLLASKMAQPSIGYYYLAGQIDFTINYNVIDADIAKRFVLGEYLYFRPSIGLRAGWIDQAIDTKLQGQISVMENVKNNFKGIGPKAGFEAIYKIYQQDQMEWDLIANFAAAYLWGNWSIKDELTSSANKIIMINNKSRNLAALNFQTALGIHAEYQNWSVKLTYEMCDWLNQFQIFDDGTGGHSNDLVLQGLTLGLSYRFG